MAVTDFTPEQILAALAEAIRPEYVGDRHDRGIAWANHCARGIVATPSLDRSDKDSLAIIDPALRSWLDKGPDYDSEDYNRGCEYGQRVIREVLDGDIVTVLELLDDAALRATRIYQEAKES